MPRAQPGATDGCWPSLERRERYGMREKKRTASTEFENRVNGALYGTYTLVKRSRENRSKNCCCTCCRACAFSAFSRIGIV